MLSAPCFLTGRWCWGGVCRGGSAVLSPSLPQRAAMKRIYIGYDPREAEAYAVCQHSLEHHIKLAGGVAGLEYEIRGLCLDDLRAAGLYTRPTGRTHAGLLWDNISGAPMSTEFAISRFLVPHLEGYQ